MEFDPEGTRLPIKIDTASNGEFEPRPLTPLEEEANRHARVCRLEDIVHTLQRLK